MLRLQTGAAAPPSEIEREAKKYVPNPSDSKETRQHKLALFERNLRSAMEMSAKGVSGSDVMREIGGSQSGAVPSPFRPREPASGGSQGQIPPDAVRMLRQHGNNPDVVRQFEDKYGVRADQFLQQR